MGYIYRLIYGLTAMLFVSAAAAQEEDWPQFRGPDRNGISKETKWNPKALSAGAKIIWKANVGLGWSTVSISGDKLLTMGNENNQDSVIALNVKDGKQVWKHSYDCKAGDYPGPRATPTIDGQQVYALSQDGRLLSLDLKTGKVKWEKNVIAEFGVKNAKWNLSGSPVVQGELLVINAGEHGLALNKQTGAKVWTSGEGPGGYACPVVYNNGNVECLAVFGRDAVFGVELKSGRKLWSSPWETEYDVNAADPIVEGGKLFISSGYKKGCTLLDVTGEAPKTLWVNKIMRNHFSSSVLVNGHLFGADGNTGSGSLKCLDFATGSEKWSHELGFSSMMAAGDYLVVLNEKGDLFIVKASPAGYEEMSSAKDLLAKRCWTSPVLCRGIIYCRNDKGNIVAVDVRQ